MGCFWAPSLVMCSISLHCIQVLCEVLFSVLPVYRVRVEGKKKMVHEGEETQRFLSQ